MSVLIILRKQLLVNRFNEILLKSIDSGEGNNAILCSGFFQENVFSASQSTGLCCALSKNKVKLTTIGVYNNIWAPQYIEFKNKLVRCGNTVISKRVKNNKWHAKIFILKKNNDPILGIIGSSNMTSRAFGIWSDFNFEADVILWDESFSKINAICANQTNENNDIDDTIYADYNETKNRGRTAMDKLRDLERELNIEGLENVE